MGTTPLTSPTLNSSTNPEWKPTSQTASDLQGIVISAYPDQPFAMLVMVQFPASAATTPNAWIAHIVPRITDSTGKRDLCINLALSAPGLRILGLPPEVMETFSLPFQQGMTTENRARFLADKPATWLWSDCDSSSNCIHAQLMIYALDQATLDSVVAAEEANLNRFGLVCAAKILQVVQLGPDNQRHEHFGFADGVSQPRLIDGHSIQAEKRSIHEIPAGEVVLGQYNTYDAPAAGPVVQESPLALAHLQPSTTEGFLDLGRNGTYLVFRQLKQDVAKFWNSMKAASAGLVDDQGQPATDKWLAQKSVGRTLDGQMLAPGGTVPGNDMTFFNNDQAGFGCPVTSHIRRANPRDGLAPTNKDRQDMINATNRHRIMRRGRIYGAPISDRYVDDGLDRGLFFICMNSEIERQFEFVQHTWLLNPMFGGKFNESDPILGSTCPFSIPSPPVRQQPVIDTFITPVGGGYFFLPSLSALRYLGLVGSI